MDTKAQVEFERIEDGFRRYRVTFATGEVSFLAPSDEDAADLVVARNSGAPLKLTPSRYHHWYQALYDRAKEKGSRWMALYEAERPYNETYAACFDYVAANHDASLVLNAFVGQHL